MSADPEGLQARPISVRPIDQEQARLLEVLRAAGGQPVTFAELRARGIENPAVLCYELEIAGVPVARVERPHLGGTPVAVGLQLDERFAAAPLPERRRWRAALVDWRRGVAGLRAREGGLVEETSALFARWRQASAGVCARAAERVQHRPLPAPASAPAPRSGAQALASLASALSSWRAHLAAAAEGLRPERGRGLPAPERTRKMLLSAVVAVVAVVAIAAALGSAPGSGHHASRELATRAHGVRAAGALAGAQLLEHSALGFHRTGASQPPAGPVLKPPRDESATRATQLQAEGHQLLAEGRYAAAAGDLRAAIAASGGSPARCREPSSEACLAYAYALYDLGRALQLQHDPGAAVPILNKRLRIDNQRSTVLAQLNSARAQLHGGTGSPPARPHRDARVRERHHSQAPRAAHPHAPLRAPQATGEQSQPPNAGGEGGPAPSQPGGEGAGSLGGGTPG